ncbi:NAD(P)-binding protein [Xylaria sp. FL1777]|nr:NAD(P)-binding protein [Xylaria sp. FL1777]
MAAVPKKLTWLITGSSSGLGLSLVRIVQANGHKVIATSRNPSKTPELVKEVESKGGKWLQLDVNDPANGKIIDELEKSGEHIDVLVNNAGYSIHGPVETITQDELRAQMETMYFGPLRLIQAVLPHQRKRKFGVIVNCSSGAALEGQGSMGAYAGPKAGLDAITKVLAKEVAPLNIRVLTVLLGSFNTNMPNAYVLSKNPFPEDYNNTIARQFLDLIQSGKIIPKGDKDKAMKALYQLVVGEGFGAGKESETFLPLGIEMTARMTLIQDQLAHAKEVFGEITNGVSVAE